MTDQITHGITHPIRKSSINKSITRNERFSLKRYNVSRFLRFFSKINFNLVSHFGYELADQSIYHQFLSFLINRVPEQLALILSLLSTNIVLKKRSSKHRTVLSVCFSSIEMISLLLTEPITI